MSMILDALKRSREEGDRPTEVPSIDTSHELTAKAGAPALGLKGLAIGIGLVVTIAFSVLMIQGSPQIHSGGISQKNTMQPNGAAQAEALSTLGRGAARSLPEVPAPALTPSAEGALIEGQPQRKINISAQDNSRVAALYRGVEAQSDFDLDDPASMADSNLPAASEGFFPNGLEVQKAPRASSLRPPSEAVAERPLQASGAASTAALGPLAGDDAREDNESDPLPFDIAAVVKRVQAELGEPALVAHGTPLLENLSQLKKNAIPTVMYTVHDWRPAGSSQVTLNGTTLGVGQQLSGFKVEEILSDSVILSYRGTAFRLRALNSWVNL